jgi:Fe-S-cluster containining protein
MSQVTSKYDAFIDNLLKLQIKSGPVIVSKIIVTGKYVDDFMSGFECKNCGKCENLSSVVIDIEDLENLAKAAHLDPLTFQSLYCIYIDRLYMKFPCPFHKVDKCTIHGKLMPKVCKLYPLNTTLCTDGLYRIGVKSNCTAGVEYLKKFEEEKLAVIPEPLEI